MELRKRKAPPTPAPPPTKRGPSKKALAAGKKGIAETQADGSSTLAGPGPVAGLGDGPLISADDKAIQNDAENGTNDSATAAAQDASIAARAADADIEATEDAGATLPHDTELSSDASVAGISAPSGTTAGLTDSTPGDTTTAPPPQSLIDPSSLSSTTLLPTASVPANPTLDAPHTPAGVANAMTDPAPPEHDVHKAGAANSDNLLEPKDSTSKAGPPKQGDRVDVATFGGTVMLEDGTSTNLAEMLGRSRKGVVLFTYPKASTPGCTKQACLFRDQHTIFTTPDPSTGYSVYGLSRDTARANTTFRTKQSLPYHLICDTEGKLLKALGLAKGDKSASRAVVVINGEGKIVARVEGGPEETVRVAREVVEREGAEDSGHDKGQGGVIEDV